MSYSASISFKQIDGENIPEFFISLKHAVVKDYESIVKSEFTFCPFNWEASWSTVSEWSDDDIANNYKDWKEKQEAWINRLVTYRWFYLKEYKILGVFGVSNSLKQYFDNTTYFQNSCDQDYEFDTWNGIELFEKIAETWKELPDDKLIENLKRDSYTEDEIGDLSYYRRSYCYKTIWENYLDDKLYNDENAVYISLLSLRFDDYSTRARMARLAYTQSIEHIKKTISEFKK